MSAGLERCADVSQPSPPPSAPVPLQASVASAVCALLPFVPTYAVALPGCVVLLAQGRLLSAVSLFALHFMAYYIGDTAILEVGGWGCGWVVGGRADREAMQGRSDASSGGSRIVCWSTGLHEYAGSASLDG